ncbi:MAG: adenosylcobinamide-GDP ribazoletransferase, partial [Chloroflexi bacterium]|nr:adenosylcobinamide-GDP ribazoletransferase [Chloroflexota bacterium]
AGFDVALAPLFASPLRDAAVVVVGVALTGGLHLDGLMDTCDGLFVPTSPERRLEIMRDSHVGSFGVVGGGLVLLGKLAALASLGEVPRSAAIVLMAVVGRWSMTLNVVVFPAGRTDGLGSLVKRKAGRGDLLFATIAAALVGYVALGLAGLAALSLVGIVVLAAALAVLRRLPGLTGDTYGALEEIAEIAVLAVLPPLFRWSATA